MFHRFLRAAAAAILATPAAATAQDAPKCEGRSAAKARAEVRQKLTALRSPDEIASVVAWANSCPAKTRDDSALTDCLQPLERMSELISASKNFKYEQIPATVPPLPEALTQQEAILRAIDWPDGQYNQSLIDLTMENLARKLPAGAKILQYRSALVGSLGWIVTVPYDDRLLVAHFDRGTINRPKGRNRTFDLMLIQIDKRKNAPSPIVSEPHRFDYFFRSGETGLLTKQRHEGSCTKDECLFCHREGMVAPTSRDVAYLRSFGAGAATGAAALKDFVALKGQLRMTNDQKPKDCMRGPPLGGERRGAASRSDDFIDRCASLEGVKLDSASRDKVRQAMNCVGCHGKSDAVEALEYPFEHNMFNGAMLAHAVRSGAMPPGSSDPANKAAHLPQELRNVLWTCLQREYFGGFGDDAISRSNSDPGLLMRYLTESCESPKGDAGQSPRVGR